MYISWKMEKDPESGQPVGGSMGAMGDVSCENVCNANQCLVTSSISTPTFNVPSLWNGSLCSTFTILQRHLVDCWRMGFLYLERRRKCKLHIAHLESMFN